MRGTFIFSTKVHGTPLTGPYTIRYWFVENFGFCFCVEDHYWDGRGDSDRDWLAAADAAAPGGDAVALGGAARRHLPIIPDRFGTAS